LKRNRSSGYSEALRDSEVRSKTEQNRKGVGELFSLALLRWGLSRPNRLVFALRVAARFWFARRRRGRREKELGSLIPAVLAISPTMRCNYDCKGCYSRGRPTDEELTVSEIDDLLSEAEDSGVLAVVVTGGEPLLIPNLPDTFRRHRRLLFVLITNGSLLTGELARRLSLAGNVVTLVSLEGEAGATDERRKVGAHEAVLRAFRVLREAGCCFGFAAMVTRRNAAELHSDIFIDGMVREGCAVGYFTEYVPVGTNVKHDWLFDEPCREEFRRKVLELRRRKPLLVIHFPHDEYGSRNRCSGAGRKSLHINSRGDVEPCPFVAVACENIRDGGLSAAFRSTFLKSIRENDRLLERRQHACALFEHIAEVETLAARASSRDSERGLH
jgi:MoaA/NifB/PqqE/SkfB family radical SAM enzyme